MGTYVNGYVLGSSVFKRGLAAGIVLLILGLILLWATGLDELLSFLIIGFGLGIIIFVLDIRINCSKNAKKV